MNRKDVRTLMSMALNESELIDENTAVRRVPGGLMYEYMVVDGESVSITAEFVPVSEQEYIGGLTRETNT